MSMIAPLPASPPGPLRLARVTRGISQRQLARAVGVDPTALSHIEAGRRRPEAATRRQIAEALGVEENELFPGGVNLG